MKELANRIQEFKNLARYGLDHQKFELACAAINAAGFASYSWNQYYKDDELELLLVEAAKLISNFDPLQYGTNGNCVLFYDGFGLDTRGLAITYLKALLNAGYEVIYVTRKKSENKQPVFESLFAEQRRCGLLKVRYINSFNKYSYKIQSLMAIAASIKPSHVFLYTLPYDVTGIIFLYLMQGVAVRYLINLTDHAFWLGIHCADYYIDFRTYGSSICANYRGIPANKLRLLPYYPYVNSCIEFGGLPFDYIGKKIIFSGGALYKTLGDPQNSFYKIVEYILDNYSDTIFYYVGNGDNSEIYKLEKKYPQRVFYSEERKDFCEIFKYTYLYLNTYPMIGGLMMQYSAFHGVLPLTLRHGNDGDGILINQNNLGIEFEDIESIKIEIDKLMKDPIYKVKEEERVRSAVPTETDFQKNLIKIMNKQQTEYKIILDNIDTSEFLKGYDLRLNNKEVFRRSVARLENIALITRYPGTFLNELIAKVGTIRRKSTKKTKS